jgi:hypothetical protein
MSQAVTRCLNARLNLCGSRNHRLAVTYNKILEMKT